MLCVPFHSSSWLLSVEGRDHNILVWFSKPCIIFVVLMVKVVLYLYLRSKSNQTKPSRNTLNHSHSLKPCLQALELKLSQVISVNHFYILNCKFLLFTAWRVWGRSFMQTLTYRGRYGQLSLHLTTPHCNSSCASHALFVDDRA